NHPKPFIKLNDNESLIQKTYLRASAIAGVEEILTITNRELFFYTKDEYEKLAQTSIFNSFILEPFGRNSAAAIALAVQYAKKKFPTACILLILPADHLIQNLDRFIEAVEQAKKLAAENYLVTFGINPDSPKTGYGYIEYNGHHVLRFVEKPNLETAKNYLDSGDYLWNSVMFCIYVDTIIEEMHQHCPDILFQSEDCIANAKISKAENLVQFEINANDFEKIQDISIDYAILEKSANVAVVPCDIGWSDIGSWIEFGQLHPADTNNNHILGETVLEEVHDCIIHSKTRMVAGIGLKGLVIADTADAILVADKNHLQDVRTVVNHLKMQENDCYKLFPTIYRAWGNYTILQSGSGFKVKRIEVKPSSSLSLQSHNHRSEHWVVVSGIAKIINDHQTITIKQSQSTYIPAGKKHKLENPGTDILIIIEVQCGDHIEEDDIVLYEDSHECKV
ncbi:MAG: mannose-1-phosphate guanylyltransferase/mannose-6-phosphate isomerase, partial [Pseudomonadota bacterium]